MFLSMVNEIGFLKAGIGPFEINRVAFSVFGIDIYWYAIIITAGMISAILPKLKPEDINNLSRHITNKETKTVIEHLPTKKARVWMYS